MVDENGQQVDDEDGLSGAPTLAQGMLSLDAAQTGEMLAASYGDELRSIVKQMDSSHEWMRTRLNALIHAMEKQAVVP